MNSPQITVYECKLDNTIWADLQDPVDGLPLVGHGHPQLAQHRERAHDVEVDAASRHDERHLSE